MVNIWKRNAIVAVVVLFVCVAVYLNWSFHQAETVDGDYESFESEMTLKENQAPPETSAIPQTDNPELPSVQETQTTYFAEARLSRQEARDSALSLLSDAADQESGSAEELTREVSAIAQSALQEVRIESLVKAKGFTDCVAFISEDQISLVVAAPASGLNQTDVAKIRDIVQSETEFSAEQIRIVEVSEPAA